jgi:cell shape-determining protein MreD
MLRFLILLFTAYLLSLFQSAVTSEIFPNFLKPDLMLIFITYLGTSPFLITGAVLALAGGLFYDTFSGSPFGLFLFIYLGIFFLFKLLGKILILGETLAVRVSLVTLAIAFQLFLLIFLPLAFGILEKFSLPGASWILPQAVTTCAACWPLFRLFKMFAALPGFAIPQPMA